jgi:hypothetical protein
MSEVLSDYLGDGLYVEFDGYQFRLYTDRGHIRHEVFLEEAVLRAFFAFVKRASAR